MKFNLIFCYTALPLLFGSNLVFATNAAVPSNVNSFIDNLNQKAVIQQQENQKNLHEFQAIATKPLNAKSSQPTKISSALQKSDEVTNGKIINCDDPNDEHNYPSNFVYDENHQKIYRLRPFAKCIVKIPTEQTPTTLEQPKTDQATTQKSTEWNINY